MFSLIVSYKYEQNPGVFTEDRNFAIDFKAAGFIYQEHMWATYKAAFNMKIRKQNQQWKYQSLLCISLNKSVIQISLSFISFFLEIMNCQGGFIINITLYGEVVGK